ncbi:alpha/beta hydrolase family protein [Leekyejoonella antrihumi]|uniref:Lysophospholipase n=1 Tax=Leekyejoonella antrihumi TaxID=1660198 RepID=A0A563E821_9MICO|nr:alpha/beta fold hydrolase [Leekyejoonella antrihumi]TWP37974.1 lysophospholipase [Leekyejoonella antrihumi]
MPGWEAGPVVDGARPFLVGPRAQTPDAIALVLHGGHPDSMERTSRRDLPLIRMLPIARDIERRSKGRVGAAVLRYAVRGWNDPHKSPVRDAVWALERLRGRFPGKPLGIVGHSMGGRVCLELAGRDDVAGVVALAPWRADSYGEDVFAETPLLVVHGRYDTVTDPRASADLVRRVRTAGGRATYLSLPDKHAMMLRARTWHRTASLFLMDTLLTGD